MSDESIRTLFDKVDALTIQVTKIETLLIDTVIANQERNNDRLNRHRQNINEAFAEIESLKHLIESTQGKIIAVKTVIIGGIGLIATLLAIYNSIK